MAEKNERKRNTKKKTTGKTAGNTSPKKNAVVKSTKSTGNNRLTKEEKERLERINRREKRIKHLILAVILLALSLFLIISIYTEVAGIIGRGISYGVLGLFGYMGYVLPFYFLVYSILLVINKGSKKGSKGTVLFTIGFFILLSAFYSINKLDMVGSMKVFSNWLHNCFLAGTNGKGGGFIGMLTAFGLTKLIGKGGAYIFTIACMLIAALITMNRPFEWLFRIILSFFKRRRDNKKIKELPENTDECSEIVYYGDICDCGDEYQFITDDYSGNAGLLGKGSFDNESDNLKTENHSKITDFMGFDGMGKKGSKIEKKDVPKKIKSSQNTEKNSINNENNVNDEELENQFSDEEFKIINEKFYKNPDDNPDAEKDDSDGLSELFHRRNNEEPFLNWVNQNNNQNSSEKEFNSQDNLPENNDVKSAEDDKAKNKAVRNNAGKNNLSGNEENKIKADIIKPASKTEEINIEKLNKEKKNSSYSYPPIELLMSNYTRKKGNEAQELNQKAALLEKTLKSFNVNAKVIKVSRGPAVTRFEVQPATGVKVNSIVRLQDDIALNLEARSIRMEAPIPGKPAVGIEIENDEKKAVHLREVVESGEFFESKSKITFAVGRDISGNSIVANLKDMPHLLIAGSTGSGKSVCVNSIIMSILFKAKPDEVRFIMVDPKVVELSNYNGIPHLLIPVVTEASKAAAALNWAVKEMEDRYRKFQEVGVRELSSYNRKAEKGNDFEKMPQIVIIIDELADLMMAAPQQVEDAICRLAQKARAAGMHLIVATQRPSVDVITGVIKANIPSRIAFAVSSQIDSRTILDCSGAEKLVGKGDMLFSPLGMGKPLRVQGTFVSDEEVQSVIDYVSNQEHEQEFSNDLMDTIETSKMTYNDDEVDELLKDAIEHIVNVGQASVSMLQRRFRIGYNRAARLVDMMEERGIVGPQDGSRPRKVFLTKEGLDELERGAKDIYLGNIDMDGDNIHPSDYDSEGVPEEI